LHRCAPAFLLRDARLVTLLLVDVWFLERTGDFSLAFNNPIGLDRQEQLTQAVLDALPDPSAF